MRQHRRIIFWQKYDIAMYQPSAYFRITVHCIAVGTRSFIEIIKGEIGMKAKGLMISRTDEESGLHRSQASYNNDFEAKDGLLSLTALGLTRSTPFGRSNADPFERLHQ
jgi:hypothetical protein